MCNGLNSKKNTHKVSHETDKILKLSSQSNRETKENIFFDDKQCHLVKAGTPVAGSAKSSIKDIKPSRLDFGNVGSQCVDTNCTEKINITDIPTAQVETQQDVNSLINKSNQSSNPEGLEKELSKSEEVLRKLKMVKMYRTKVKYAWYFSKHLKLQLNQYVYNVLQSYLNVFYL